MRSWKTGFLAMFIEAWLSHLRGIGITLGTCSSCNKRVNHANSVVTRFMDLYSASAELKATVGCFFDFQEIGDPPSVTK